MNLLTHFNFIGKKNFHSRKYFNLSSKFFILYLFFIIIPFFIIGIVGYRYTSKNIEKDFNALTLQNLSQSGLIIDKYLFDMEQFTESMASEKSLIKDLFSELKASSSENLKASAPLKIKNPIAILFGNSNSKLDNSYYITDSASYDLYDKSMSASNLETISSGSWYGQTLRNPDSSNLIGVNIRFYEGGIYNYVISTAKAVREPLSGKFKGVLVTDYDYNSFTTIFNSLSSNDTQNTELYLTDKDFNVMYYKDTGLLTLKLKYSFLGNKSISKLPRIYAVNGKKMYVFKYVLPHTSWNLFEMIPVQNVSGSIYKMDSTFIMVISICFILILAFPLVLFSMFFKPFIKLSVAISGKEKSNYTSSSQSDKSIEKTNEINKDENTTNFNSLINKVYYSQLKQKEVQLVALQNQINPHFLYNTLESIRGAALHNGVQSIASMAKNLSSFFRYSIDEEVLVPIKAEIQHLENYISIQNFRHDDKFEFTYKVPEEFYEYKILKLTLQPLVENAIKHGLEMKIGKGRIKIDVLGMESIIKILVYDDGIGMTTEKIAELNKTLEGDIPIRKDISADSGVGVRNVNSRIRLYFGNQYGLRYLSTSSGTTVEVTLPAVI